MKIGHQYLTILVHIVSVWDDLLLQIKTVTMNMMKGNHLFVGQMVSGSLEFVESFQMILRHFVGEVIQTIMMITLS